VQTCSLSSSDFGERGIQAVMRGKSSCTSRNSSSTKGCIFYKDLTGNSFQMLSRSTTIASFDDAKRLFLLDYEPRWNVLPPSTIGSLSLVIQKTTISKEESWRLKEFDVATAGKKIEDTDTSLLTFWTFLNLQEAFDMSLLLCYSCISVQVTSNLTGSKNRNIATKQFTTERTLWTHWFAPRWEKHWILDTSTFLRFLFCFVCECWGTTVTSSSCLGTVAGQECTNSIRRRLLDLLVCIFAIIPRVECLPVVTFWPWTLLCRGPQFKLMTTRGKFIILR
jgi:hypothetical protein